MADDLYAGRVLGFPISRRRFIGAGAAGGAALLAVRSFSPARVFGAGRDAVRVLSHDVVHEPAAFARGRLDGVRSGTMGALQGPGRFESAIIESPFLFTHVGLHWRSEGTEPSFEIRTSFDGRTWSPWSAASIEARPEETPRGETFASLVSAPKDRFVQYGIELPELASVRSVTATLLNSVDGPAIESRRGAIAGHAGSRPVDFTRDDWGADEDLRFNGASEIWPSEYVPVKKLIVHHTVSSNSYSDAAAQVRAIYAYHASTLGWGDIGYNALVDRFGRSYEGRYGRERGDGTREVLSQDVVAGHTLSYNHGSFGVALIGNFEAASPPADLRMLARLVEVLSWAAEARLINAFGASDYLLANGTWHRGLADICGHRDCAQTACPGQFMYDALPAIRELVSAQLDGGRSGVELVSGPGGVRLLGEKLSYGWRDPVGQAATFSYYLEGWRFGNAADVQYLSGFDANASPQWSAWGGATSAAFLLPADGRYTFHVRSRDADGRVTKFEANRTVLADVEEDDVAAIDDLNRRSSVAALFFHASGYTMRGEALPNDLKNQLLFLLALAGTAGASGPDAPPTAEERDFGASVFLQAAGHALTGEPLPANLTESIGNILQ